VIFWIVDLILEFIGIFFEIVELILWSMMQLAARADPSGIVSLLLIPSESAFHFLIVLIRLGRDLILGSEKF
jgi:hypothetical protein